MTTWRACPGPGEPAVQPAGGDVDETVKLGCAHHGPTAVDPEQADERPVAAQEGAVQGGGREQEALQRLAPDRPGEAERVFENAIHGQAIRVWGG